MGINWATPLILLAIYGLVRYFARPNPIKTNKISWTPLESVAITLAIYFGGQFIGALLIYAFPLLFGRDQQIVTNWLDNNAYGEFLLVAAVETVTFFLLLRFLKKRGASLKTIGLKNKPRFSDIGWVLIGFAIYFIVYLFLLYILKAVLPRVDTNQQQIIGFNEASGAQLPFVFVSLAVLPPIVEELMVRGFLYSGLKKGLPIIWAALITSVLFATAHLQAGNGKPLLWTAALDTFVLSFVLIYLREKTNSLWACIGLHMLKNTIAFLSLFVFHIV